MTYAGPKLGSVPNLRRTHRARGALALAAALLVAGACTDAPLPPDPPPPRFLIGDSPLQIELKQEQKTVGDLTLTIHYIEIKSDVSGGIAQVKNEDRFTIRATVDFTKLDGSQVGIVDPKVDIPAAEWTKLVAANPQPAGNAIDANVTLELILTDGAGKEHLLDSASGTATIDPKSGPWPTSPVARRLLPLSPGEESRSGGPERTSAG